MQTAPLPATPGHTHSGNAANGADPVACDSASLQLLEIARLIRSGEGARAPMGLLAVGPMGAGKTFVIKAFLKEAGLSGVALKIVVP